MKVDIFDFAFDKSLIADKPAEPRDACRLLDLSDPAAFRDRAFLELPQLLEPGDLLVFNDTKVIPAKLYGQRGEARVEVTLYRPETAVQWWSFIKNSKRLHLGDTIKFAADFQAVVKQKQGEDGVLLEFSCPPEELPDKLEKYGSMPLPPYIKRENPDSRDKQNYQTVYAKNEGAVAAPTAGLHFTGRVFEALEAKGIKTAFLTLHVGAGTFLPVKAEDTDDHKMHAEYGVIAPETAALINETKQKGKRIIAVGTTSLRLLESAADKDKSGTLKPFAGETDIFITPGYKFKIIDAIVTNFHLPKSTLFMLVSAIAGLERMQAAYAHAQREKYRFYSYGDACFIPVKLSF